MMAWHIHMPMQNCFKLFNSDVTEVIISPYYFTKILTMFSNRAPKQCRERTFCNASLAKRPCRKYIMHPVVAF
jgi:hypothetical protein